MADQPFGMGISPSDFGWLANQYNPAQLSQGEIEALQGSGLVEKGLGQFRDLESRLAAENQANAAPPMPKTTTIKDDPKTGQRTWSISGLSEDEVIAYQRAMQFQKEALGGFAQQAQQIQTELQRAQAQPWQQLGTALAANMANQPGMPAWVRGLGATAAQMNPTVDQLRAQYLGVMGKGSDIAKDVVGEGIAQERTDLERQQVGLQLAREERVAKDQVRRDVSGIYERNLSAAAAGKITDPTPIYDLMRGAGATEEFARSASNQLKQLSDDATVVEMQRQAALTERDKRNAEAAMDRVIQQGKNSLAAIDKRLQESETKTAQKEADKEKDQAAKLDFQEYQKVRPKLQGLLALEENSNRLLKDMEEMDRYIGAIKGKKPGWFVQQEEARLRFAMFTQLDAIRRTIEAGARFWNPQEFQNLSPKLTLIDKPQKVNKGIVQETLSWISQERKAAVYSAPDVKWFTPARKVALGGDADPILKDYQTELKNAGLEKVPEIPSGPGAPATAIRQQFPNLKTGKNEWFRLRNGEWVKE